MVRLKVWLKISSSGKKTISIPYGSIKRWVCQESTYKFTFISIPYGSIKRRGDNDVFAFVVFAFQFLMVRLKATFTRFHPAQSYISIPYGSIKSITQFSIRRNCRISIPYGSIKSRLAYRDTEQCSISIPYGSIKRCKCAKTIRFCEIFQFLMVRLKVKLQLWKQLIVLYFNSLWFD